MESSAKVRYAYFNVSARKKLKIYNTTVMIVNPRFLGAIFIRPVIGHDHKHIFSILQHLPFSELQCLSSSEGCLLEVEITVILGVCREQGMVYGLIPGDIVHSTEDVVLRSLARLQPSEPVRELLRWCGLHEFPTPSTSHPAEEPRWRKWLLRASKILAGMPL
jgi:hypothetical protein